MKTIIALAIAIATSTATAETFVCTKGKSKIISTEPCTAYGATTTRQIATSQGGETYTPDLNQQLANIQQNRRDIASQQEAAKPAIKQAAAQPDKTFQCNQNWQAQKAIDASARANSTQWHRDEKKRLQDERWNLGC